MCERIILFCLELGMCLAYVDFAHSHVSRISVTSQVIVSVCMFHCIPESTRRPRGLSLLVCDNRIHLAIDDSLTLQKHQ